MAEPGSTPHTLLTLCSEAWAQWSCPWAGNTCRAFAQNGESSQRRQTGLCLFAVDGAVAETLWDVWQISTRPGRFLGCAIALAWASLGLSLGGPRPFPSPGIQLSRPGQEFRPLWTVHMATMGPILRTLENTSCGERMDSCWTQGPSVPQFTSGHKWGQRTAFMAPLSVFPGGRCPTGPFHAKALKSQNREPARG